MFPTVETRWFYRGAIPTAVQDWFHSGERAPETQPVRTDSYLQPAAPGDMGIKLREGRLEIKQRAEQYGVTCFHEKACGAIEHWQKWGFEAAEGRDVLNSLVKPGTSWIAVQKARQLRRYRVREGGTVEAISTLDYTERGCSIELTEIEVYGKDWWSVAFEAFGADDTLLENLFLVAQRAFAAENVPALDAQHSFGYAHWLATSHHPPTQLIDYLTTQPPNHPTTKQENQ